MNGVTHHSGVSLVSSHLLKFEELNADNKYRPVRAFIHWVVTLVCLCLCLCVLILKLY